MWEKIVQVSSSFFHCFHNSQRQSAGKQRPSPSPPSWHGVLLPDLCVRPTEAASLSKQMTETSDQVQFSLLSSLSPSSTQSVNVIFKMHQCPPLISMRIRQMTHQSHLKSPLQKHKAEWLGPLEMISEHVKDLYSGWDWPLSSLGRSYILLFTCGQF